MAMGKKVDTKERILRRRRQKVWYGRNKGTARLKMKRKLQARARLKHKNKIGVKKIFACSVCGYDQCQEALLIHTPTGDYKSLQRMRGLANNGGALLCLNCNAEFHAAIKRREKV